MCLGQLQELLIILDIIRTVVTARGKAQAHGISGEVREFAPHVRWNEQRLRGRIHAKCFGFVQAIIYHHRKTATDSNDAFATGFVGMHATTPAIGHAVYPKGTVRLERQHVLPIEIGDRERTTVICMRFKRNYQMFKHVSIAISNATLQEAWHAHPAFHKEKQLNERDKDKNYIFKAIGIYTRKLQIYATSNEFEGKGKTGRTLSKPCYKTGHAHIERLGGHMREQLAGIAHTYLRNILP